MAYRVIQWATGAIGKTCLRQIIDHPDLELAGLYVHSEHKAGKDAGEIARRPATGILATNNIDDILNIDADCVLYLPLQGKTYFDHEDNVRRLLRSGKNVIATTGYVFPQAQGPDHLQGLEDACRAGNATVFGTGINPGFLFDRIAANLTSVCCTFNSMTMTEVYDCSEILSPSFIFDHMGVGQKEEKFREGTALEAVFHHMFIEVLGYLGMKLGFTFDDIVADHEFGIAPHEIGLPVGVAPKGGVVNFRWRWHARIGGKPICTVQMIWLLDGTLPGWDLKDGWTIEIDGAPGLKVQIDLIEPQGMPDRSKAMQYAVAGPVIRAIPEVCKAPPGILLAPTFATYSTRMT